MMNIFTIPLIGLAICAIIKMFDKNTFIHRTLVRDIKTFPDIIAETKEALWYGPGVDIARAWEDYSYDIFGDLSKKPFFAILAGIILPFWALIMSVYMDAFYTLRSPAGRVFRTIWLIGGFILLLLAHGFIRKAIGGLLIFLWMMF